MYHQILEQKYCYRWGEGENAEKNVEHFWGTKNILSTGNLLLVSKKISIKKNYIYF